jgi:mono/diheme cytochrome c family protein
MEVAMQEHLNGPHKFAASRVVVGDHERTLGRSEKETEDMHRRQLVLISVILGMGLTVFEARADNTAAHGHSDAPVKPVELAQASTSQGMTGQGMMGQGMMGPGLMMPSMDSARGRKLFASKGCVVCHSINGVGGEDAPPLDAATMPGPMNPFEFTAKMWRGAEAMITMQREELGEQIEFTGDELADIIAFAHHPEEQKKFSETDIPPRIMDLMHHMDEGQTEEHKKEHKAEKPKE